ncbi:D-aminoacyl-tRNA deacylase [Desulfobacula toluolica]|uniref:D-aminoacyl-tRNA deacylase n=1 Tax=Desulfobacula toluolica (strain DSM 7467 / Tol2) TaxID=651182 RepID=K0NHG9_DESTT|nr:D-aminoacyl-tRNA deacylase [Desulfobacula toluolica]CCK79313.1 Dtd: D-tyrosyl-tRNA(Tyr) deacylase [Desulfobacula toluolica Tol2]
MKAVVQRVKKAQVKIDNTIVSSIGNGLLVLLGVQEDDTQKDADFLVEKVINLRIFEDDNGKMNISLKDVKGELLVVSQFTLLGDCRKGRRPSFIKAAPPEKAIELYEYFISQALKFGIATKSGVFQAMMDVSLINQGPVTLLLDTQEK